jgi:uroporphyrinogen-III synthase
VAPALIEVPLEHNEAVFSFANRLYAGEFDMMVFLTGVGARLLQRVLASREPEEHFRDALRKLTIVARGPKPAAVLREWNVPVTINIPEPNTWRELLAALESRPEKSVAIQEYGRPSRELQEGLERQGRSVTAIPVYQWRLPDDTVPLETALNELRASKFDAVLFTTGVQIEHFLEFAAQRGQSAAALESLRRLFVASIGPTCSESLRSCGVTPALEPTHPKMGILVREAAAKFAEQKRSH